VAWLALAAAMALCASRVASAAKPPTPTPTPAPPTPAQVAQPAAEAWLALADAGQFGESWDAAAETFKKAVTRKQWVDALTQVRAPLGAVTTRKFRASQFFTDLPNAPTGEYVVIEFESKFANGGDMIERITPMKDPDGTWRVSGYFVVPAK
jgi:Protein of unknown function (DUF4019)